MKLAGGFAISGVSGFWSVEISEMARSAVKLDFCHPAARREIKGNAFEPGCIIARTLAIMAIIATRRLAEIGETIIAGIAVHMVYLRGWPCSGSMEPYKAMSLVEPPVDPDMAIHAAVQCSRSSRGESRIPRSEGQVGRKMLARTGAPAE